MKDGELEKELEKWWRGWSESYLCDIESMKRLYFTVLTRP